MTNILADFFREIKSEDNYADIDKVIYLLQGQLTSNIKQFPKMGLAEKMLFQAVSLHSGINTNKIKEVLIKKS